MLKMFDYLHYLKYIIKLIYRGVSMKKLLCLLALFMLFGCSSKESVEVDYVHSNHKEIAEKVLGNALGKEETQKAFDAEESLEVYYEEDGDNVKLVLLNKMDYYFTGNVEFDVCPFKIDVVGLAPNGYASKTIECPEFTESSEFVFTGKLYSRKEEYEYNVKYESYYYEDDETLYDYSLDLKEITNDDLKAFVNFLYTESVLANYEGEMWVRVYPKEAYDKAYNTDTDAAWNELDTKYLAGKIWIDSENALAEIYHPTKDELIERINFAK